MRRGHEIVDHTADTGIRARAPTVEELFEECAAGVFGIMYADGRGQPAFHDEIEATGGDLENLLVAWLSELLWTAETRHVALTRFRVDHIEVGRVVGQTWGWPVDDVELIGPPIKAVTYHGLRIEGNGSWSATVIVDV